MSITLDGTNGFTTDNAALKLDGTTLVVDDTNNRVGIGTSSPNSILDIVATTNTIRLGRSTSSYATIDSNSNAGSLSLNADAGNSAGGGSMTFNFAGSEKARIDSSGNLLVGTTGFGTVGSTAGIALYADGRILSSNVSNGSYFARMTTDGGVIYFRKNTTTVGNISVTGSATAYNTSSDYRLKEDWQPMTGASERVKALKPVNFAWKVDGSRVDGFLAHEAQEVVPEAVTGVKDAVDADGNPVYQGIDQSKLVPLLTAALQEALTKIDSLTARIEALEATNV